MGGWGWRRPRHYGGGCLSNLMGLILLPFVLIFVLLLTMCNGVDVQTNNGYDEEAFQDYANAQYREIFGASTAYEDNLLIVFLTSEDYHDYYYIAWVGDHIAPGINYMMGSNGSQLGWAMESWINESNYKYSLDSNLAQVMREMTNQIQKLGLQSSYTCSEDHIQAASKLINHSSVEMTDSTVNDALTAFTDNTGIPVSIVVEDMTDVFGSQTTALEGSQIAGTVLAIVGVIAVVVIVILVINKRKNRKTDTEQEVEDRNRRYRDFDDQYK